MNDEAFIKGKKDRCNKQLKKDKGIKEIFTPEIRNLFILKEKGCNCGKK